MGNSKRNVSRRDALKTIGGIGALTTLAGCTGGVVGSGGSETIKIGLLESRSGVWSTHGTQKTNAARLAVKELNEEEGGILDRDVELVAPDPQSDTQRYQQLARRLINEENVDVLMGTAASSNREAIRPIVDENQQLYFYNNQYEGGVCDTHTWCTGAVPEQQITPVLPSLVDEFGEDIYIIASDYNFGQITADWYETVADEIGANVMESEFIPLEVSQFGPAINRIQSADPDLLVVLVVGNNAGSFYPQKNSAGLDVPMNSTVNMAQTYEHLRYDAPALQDMYVGVNYMQEIPTDRNENFVDRFYEEFPDAEYIGQMAQDEYFAIKHIYKNAVEKAGTADQDEVMATLDEEPMEIPAPEGDIVTDPETHHVSHTIRIAHALEDHSIEFTDTFENVEPYWLAETPYPGCDLTQTIGASSDEPMEQYQPQG